MNLTKSPLFVVFFILITSCKNQPYQTQTATSEGYTYEYVTDDPTQTRIYTLENGLKVYLSRFENAPRIHVFTAVKAGGKNDPKNNTGLAHYLEHMMFKGNQYFGTKDYQAEKPLLDSIEQLFNNYAKLTDPEQRKAIYKNIDNLSNEAALLAIPNEYDKMISMIGGKRLNAYTTEDRTVYTVDIPSNEMERFITLEGLRFKQIVNRLFHTELEAVYEEKNRSLDSDIRKQYWALYQSLFPGHPYGEQSVIGTVEHLKNPSITEIRNYFDKYYRPNNVAICMSGELDFDKTIALIDQYFGDWEANPELPELSYEPVAEITSPIEKEVLGPDRESVLMGYRFDGKAKEDLMRVNLIDMLLSNRTAGLIDLNLVQKQKVLGASATVRAMNDFSIHILNGRS
jgi:zinc protease